MLLKPSQPNDDNHESRGKVDKMESDEYLTQYQCSREFSHGPDFRTSSVTKNCRMAPVNEKNDSLKRDS